MIGKFTGELTGELIGGGLGDSNVVIVPEFSVNNEAGVTFVALGILGSTHQQDAASESAITFSVTGSYA